ncbi:MAG: NAD(P)/FAD-dependent oxidoreductase [Thermoplasmata archaeon]
MKDIIIVGAGPAGNRLAMLIARTCDIVLLEEHEKIGEPTQCAGLVSPRCIDGTTRESVLCQIRDFVLHSPSGRKLELHAKEPKGFVIDRPKYDTLLAEAAVENGAELLTKTRATKLSLSGESVQVGIKSDGAVKELNGKLAVGADGPKSFVRKTAGFAEFDLLYYGAQATGILKDDISPDAVEMYLGNSLAPGFFAWKIPAGDRVRIGLCSLREGTPFNLLDALLKSRFPNFKQETRQAGIVPIGSLGSFSKGRVILIGDAAGQTKPLTGGGVYLGKMAAEMLAEAIRTEGPSIAAGELYEKMFRTEFGRELSRAWRLRRVMNEMSDDKLDRAVELLSDERILRMLEEAGDIDYPANLSAVVLRKAPQLLQFFPELLRSGL